MKAGRGSFLLPLLCRSWVVLLLHPGGPGARAGEGVPLPPAGKAAPAEAQGAPAALLNPPRPVLATGAYADSWAPSATSLSAGTAAPPPAPPPAAGLVPPLTPPAGCPPGKEAPPSVHTPNAAVNPTERLLPIDLPYALRLVNAANPTIAIARERVAEAYAVLGQAKVLWVPDLWVGGNPYAPTFLPTFFHHNGTIQNSQGIAFKAVDRNAFFLPVGSALSYSLADAVFAPRIARQGAAAAEARARAVRNDLQLEVALAYLELLRAYGALSINYEALQKAKEMLRAATSAVKQGLGKTAADADRARTEVSVLEQRRLVLQEDAARASAALAQLLLLDSSADLLPADQTVVPIALVPTGGAIDELTAVALLNRPELAESRALIAAALARWRQAKYRPLIPTLQAFTYYGSYVAGNPTLATAGGRTDVIAQASWELKNFGLGDLYAARERRAQYNVANLHAVEVQARIAAEVAVAVKVVRQREKAVREAQVAVRNAEEMWRKLEAVAFGIGLPARQYDPLEPLLAERALLEARLLYLENVIEYNRNQFRLYWALGQPPECSLPQAKEQPVETPVMPPPYEPLSRKGETKPPPEEEAPALPVPRKEGP
jgi:outer membrane protein TolC